ncbi:hypothetical protein PtB15_6B780 [Puccinia triticina]|nr:hypothetical protein PtB15_6B780 [Puccinia triticina]
MAAQQSQTDKPLSDSSAGNGQLAPVQAGTQQHATWSIKRPTQLSAKELAEIEAMLVRSKRRITARIGEICQDLVSARTTLDSCLHGRIGVPHQGNGATPNHKPRQ